MKKVLIPTKLDAIAAELLTAHGGYEVIQDAQTPLAELVAANTDAYALIVRSEPIPSQVIDALPQLRVIVRAGAGFDTIDIKYARKKGVDVMNTPGANANAVAELVIAMMLADARHLISADASVRRGEWEKKAFMGRELTGKTVGVVGLGNIGRLVVKRLRGFECRILGYDPQVATERVRDMGVEPVSMEELFSEADYVSLHVPGGESTRGLVGTKYLGLMKKGATLINCARSGIISEEALREAKNTKGIRFLNDVYPKDAPGEKVEAKLAEITLPHLGASTHEANYVAAERAARELIDRDDKGVTSFVVNRDIPEGLDKAYCELAYNLARLTRQLAGEDAPPKMIETSFYGQLEPFSKWLLTPVLSAIWSEFDRFNDHKEAINFIKETGVEYINRQVDSAKGFANSITIDLIVEQSNNRLKRTSVRGTLAEGVQMVSRINEFDRLYFEPHGAMLVCVYPDRPGVTATISRHLAEANINIEDMRNPHDTRTNRSLAIIKVNKPASDEMMALIAKDIDAHSAVCVAL